MTLLWSKICDNTGDSINTFVTLNIKKKGEISTITRPNPKLIATKNEDTTLNKSDSIYDIKENSTGFVRTKRIIPPRGHRYF